MIADTNECTPSARSKTPSSYEIYVFWSFVLIRAYFNVCSWLLALNCKQIFCCWCERHTPSYVNGLVLFQSSIGDIARPVPATVRDDISFNYLHVMMLLLFDNDSSFSDSHPFQASVSVRRIGLPWSHIYGGISARRYTTLSTIVGLSFAGFWHSKAYTTASCGRLYTGFIYCRYSQVWSVLTFIEFSVVGLHRGPCRACLRSTAVFVIR